MPNQELIDYINKSKEAGQTDEQIRFALNTSGWQTGDIEEAFKATAVPHIDYSDLMHSKPKKSGTNNSKTKKIFKYEKTLAVILVVVAWGLSFWVLYEQIPDVKHSIDKFFSENISLDWIFPLTEKSTPSVKESVPSTKESAPSASDPNAISLQQINNLGYTFFLGQIDYLGTPAISDDTKNTFTQIIYKVNFPKSLLKTVPIIIINTLAVTPKQYIDISVINDKISPLHLPSFNSLFMEGGSSSGIGIKEICPIFINKTKMDSLEYILTHELGHCIGNQLTKDEWATYYKLRGILSKTPIYETAYTDYTNWQSVPAEDFAEVYRNIFTGLTIRTKYGVVNQATKNFINQIISRLN